MKYYRWRNSQIWRERIVSRKGSPLLHTRSFIGISLHQRVHAAGLRTGRIFSVPLALSAVTRVPLSLSHFPVGCYCRVFPALLSLNHLFSDTAPRRHARHSRPRGSGAKYIRANISRINVGSAFLPARKLTPASNSY